VLPLIVEAIWSLRNHRADVDREYFDRSSEITVRDMRLRVAPPEEMIWAKLYILVRERSDWPDILNYFYYCAAGLDWRHLFDRLGEDAPLLTAALPFLRGSALTGFRPFLNGCGKRRGCAYLKPGQGMW
jgi:hypothetical protein